MISCNHDNNKSTSSFQIEDGFNLELVASEPLIQDPVDLEFNELGDVLILEMPGYPLEDKQSRIKVLKDSDHNGVYDEQILFAENLQMASSIMPYKKGVLVAAPPYLLFLKDEDQNYKVESVDTLMGGFSTGNLQHNYNGLTYGLDGWIYAVNGGNSGHPFWWGDTTSVMDLRGKDFRFNLDQKVIERLGKSSGGFGLGVDEYGRLFETHNLKHISHLVFPDRYLNGARLLMENPLSNISDHEENGLARIYPIGEQESRVNHPEQSGYFSGSCGITYYGGGAYGSEYENTIWVADVVLNLIHVDKIKPFGTSFQASRVFEKKDFLASNDRSFRPVNMSVGMDGALYVIDMHRQVIEHPEWIPDVIEKTLDLNAGKDKGRVYKITQQGFENEKFNTEKFKSVGGCVESLSHPNQWVRRTAHRLLVERELNESDYQSLKNSLHSKNEWAKLHAMWVLNSKRQIQINDLIMLLNDSVPAIRESALMVAEAQINSNENLVKSIFKHLTDENQRVRMQAALTISLLKKTSFENNWDSIKKGIIDQSLMPTDDWNIASLTLSSSNNPIDVFKDVLAAKEEHGDTKFLESLALMGSVDINATLDFLNTLPTEKLKPIERASIIHHLVSGNAKGPGKTLLSSIEKLEKGGDLVIIAALNELRRKHQLPASIEYLSLSKEALTKVLDNSLTEQARLDQLSLLASLPYAAKSDALFQCLVNAQPLAIQEQALRQLSTYPEIGIGKKLVNVWKELGPQTRRLASDLLLYNKTHHDALLTGLENETISIGEMNFDLERRRTLLWWSDNEETKRRAAKLFSDVGVTTRKEAIEKMNGALRLIGDSKKGSKVFQNVCSHCHIFGDTGKDVGPVLTEISRKSKETLLHDILDPNAAANTQYISHRLETKAGEIHIGIVKNETDQSITIIKMGGESVTVEKNNIKTLTSLGKSLMMEGLEGSMTPQEMADLLSYLQNQN